MTKSIKRNINIGIIVVLLIVYTVIFHNLWKLGVYPMIAESLRMLVYIGLYIGWGFPSVSGLFRHRCAVIRLL